MQGVLLVNLGSPDSPQVADVRRYLDEFLMDPDVIDLPWVLRRAIVSLLVLPKRSHTSAKLYQSIWWAQGSPLKVLTERLSHKVQQVVGDVPVAWAMRYGSPSIAEALAALHKRQVTQVKLIPLYPHYAMSTVRSTVQKTTSIIKAQYPTMQLKVAPVFYRHPDYIRALVHSAQPYLQQPYDHILFSYHSVPERHVRKDDPTGKHCLTPNCCTNAPLTTQRFCYRYQVLQTTQAFAKHANIPQDRYSVSFQSRLGRAKWLTPSTEQTLEQLAKQGVKRLLVICPAFVSDCLETLEEIGIQGKTTFLQAGGEQLTLIPCLNDQDEWANTLGQWAVLP